MPSPGTTPPPDITALPAEEPIGASATERGAPTFRALRHRNFRLFLSGQGVSLIGTWMQSVAQSWLVYRLTHSELLLGTAMFCSQIAVFALGPLGGVASDRFSRHKVVIVTQTCSMLQAFALAALTLSGKVEVWHVFALAVLLGAINAFDMPGRQSLLIQMTSKEDLLSAISLNSAVFNAARSVGPGVAGLLVAWLGEGVCFLLNGFSFLAVIGSLLAMRLAPFERKPADSPWRHLVDGFRYARSHREVRRVLSVMAAATISNMPVLVLAPVFADQIFHRGAQGLGYLLAALGVGAVIGTLSLARSAEATQLQPIIAFSGVAMGAVTIAFGLSPWYTLSLLIMPLIGYSVFRQMASANTTIQTLILDEYRGRIMSMYGMTIVGLGPFGSLAAGALAGRFGARATTVLGGMLAMGSAGVFGWTLRGRKSA